MLFLTAFIWGTAFVAQSVGMDYLGPFGFNGIRSFIGGIALLPCIYLLGKLNKGEKGNVENSGKRKDLIAGGLSCGVILFAASSMQQLGLQYTTAGKAGFITAFYIVLVPVLGIFLKQKTGWKVWLAVAIALAGLYFLCITESFSIGKGDIYVFIGALLFSLHILVIDHFAPKVDGVALSCIQFLVCGILCAVPMLALERPQVDEIQAAWMPLAYAGVLSCGVAYTLQVIAQKNTDPTVASLLLSLESVFSVLTGWVILGERLSGRELFGCALVFAAVLLAQLPGKKMAPERGRNLGEKAVSDTDSVKF